MRRCGKIVRACLVLASIAPAVQAEPANDYEKWLPKDTVAVVTLRDPARTAGRLQRGVFKAMWNDPALGRLRGEWENAVREGFNGVTAESVFELLGGRAVFGATMSTLR